MKNTFALLTMSCLLFAAAAMAQESTAPGLKQLLQTGKRLVEEKKYAEAMRYLDMAIGEFVEFYNHRRYHRANQHWTMEGGSGDSRCIGGGHAGRG